MGGAIVRDEARILRTRHAESLSSLDRLASPLATGTAKTLGTVVAPGSGVTLSADHYVTFNPTEIDGAEAEGGNVTLFADTASRQPGIVIGGTPAVGDVLVFSSIGGRWIARKLGGDIHAGTGPGNIPNCFCQGIPATLAMTSSSATANGGMFQSGSISWQATPSWAASLNLGDHIFLGNSSFHDSAADADFYYYLACDLNEFSITRLYPTSPFGSPYRDGVLYAWRIDDTTNKCVPFRLDNGLPFNGSDPVTVTIDG